MFTRETRRNLAASRAWSRRLGRLEEFIGAIIQLAPGAGSSMNGSVVLVDGETLIA